MSKLSIAVCDENQSYGESVGTWLFIERGKDFSGGYFSSAEVFKKQYSRQRFQVILLGRTFLLEEWIQTEIARQKDTLWLYLKGEGEIYPGTEVPEEMIPAVEKYQPVSALIRNIFCYYEQYQKENIEMLGKNTEILGWFSPEHNIWQTPLAMTMAMLLAEKEKVLYVNLKDCSGFGKWFQEEYEHDLLDVMYFCQSPEQSKAAEVGRFVYSSGPLDYLPPVRDGVLLSELEEADYQGFLELLKKTSYDIILLDMGNMFPGFFRVWKQCRCIYLPQEENVLARGIAREFEEMVKHQKDLELEEKMVWLTLPEWRKEQQISGGVLQEWIWGGQGDYVRELLDGRSRRD